tara:strand:+ start:633 stop:1118 length:486 start_codon:yes stop_codon:yes gene_type:complete
MHSKGKVFRPPSSVQKLGWWRQFPFSPVLLMTSLAEHLPCGHLEFGPLDVDYLAGSNWTKFRLMLVTNRNCDKARRETGVELGFKSEHLLDVVGVDNPADSFVHEGQTYYGLIYKLGKAVHSLSAEQRFSSQLAKQVAEMSPQDKERLVSLSRKETAKAAA